MIVVYVVGFVRENVVLRELLYFRICWTKAKLFQLCYSCDVRKTLVLWSVYNSVDIM